jgi:hypothetical protein
VSQLPKRTPFIFTPLIRMIPLANSGARSPLSACLPSVCPDAPFGGYGPKSAPEFCAHGPSLSPLRTAAAFADLVLATNKD